MNNFERRILENQVAIMRFLKVALAYPSAHTSAQMPFVVSELRRAMGETEVVLHEGELSDGKLPEAEK